MKSETIAKLFTAALDLPKAERRGFLETSEASPEIRREVARLLMAHGKAGSFLEGGVSLRGAALVESVSEEARTERLIGPYLVKRELGRGGMGVVYLAERTGEDFEQRVALKVIRGGHVSEEILQRFVRERSILAGMEHSGVARLLDGGVTLEGDPFIAMEYVEGEPLTAYCDGRNLGIEERLRLFVEICRTVQYAHTRLIVHRDLKPSNILVTPEGVTKLLDFGIAKLLGESAENQETLTQEGQQALTPEYAAPEQVRGEVVTTATDVYALGVILYRLLTGRRPYSIDATSGNRLAKAVCETQPQTPSVAVSPTKTSRVEGQPDPAELSRLRRLTPSRLKRRLAGDLDKVILKALRKDPSRRYASADAFADDLERHLNGLPVRARPATLRYRAHRFVQRHRLGVLATILLITTLLAGLAGTAWQGRIAAKERDRAEQEATKAEEVKDFVLGLFEASNPAESKGAAITARELLDRGAERIEIELSAQPPLQAEMFEVIGGVNLSLGEYKQAAKLFEQALSVQRALGDRVAEAEAMRWVAEVQQMLGDFREAESLNRAALEIQRKKLGPQDVEVGRTLSQLADILTKKGEFTDAEAISREALVIQRRELGGEHLDTLAALSTLGTITTQIGNYDRAEAMFRESWAGRKKALGAEHPEVIRDMVNLASVLSLQAKYQDAERLHRQALNLRLKLLGEDHPDIAESINELASTLLMQGKYAEAEPLNRQALRLDRQALGNEHLWVAMDLDNLAVAVTEQGRLEEGFALSEEAHAMFQSLVGDQSPHTAMSRLYQGVIRRYQGRLEDAERLLQETLKVLRIDPGPSSPSVAMVLTDMGGVHLDRGEYEEARKSFAESLRIKREKFRAAHPSTIIPLSGLGEALLGLDRTEEGETFLREALKVGEINRLENDWRIALTHSVLGETLGRKASPEAEAMLHQGYEGLREARGDWHPATRRAFERLETSTKSP